ncbi:MAG: TonB C-terminal domain-containing protein [Moraxella sp.]|nr:TonB C-terminal domain-containing protein [Moraxella sp.]
MPTVGQGQSQHGAGSGSSGNAGSSGGSNKSSVISGIQERIHRNWSPEAGLKGKRLTATIRLDGSGNLTDIQFGSGDSSLKPSLERAIRASAPFPEAVGVLTNFTANFYAD